MFGSVAVSLIFYYLPLVLFAKKILVIWINADFAEKAYNIVRIMIIVSFFSLIQAVIYVLLQSAGKMRDIAIACSISTLFFVISLYSLTKFYGIYGVVFSFAIMYVVQIAVCTYFLTYRKILN